MIDWLVSWTESAPTDVRLCVSSGEYEVFRKAFGEDKRFRFQDVTGGDVGSFVRERLKGFQGAKDDEISAENDERLPLREGAHHDNELANPSQRVKDMPQGMEPLFKHLFNSINPSDRQAACRTLAVVTKLREFQCLDMSLFRYTFLEHFEKKADFALEASFKDSNAGEAEIHSRTERAPTRLNGQLRGFLEIKLDHCVSWKINQDPNLISDKVQFGRLISCFFRMEAFQDDFAVLQVLLSCLRNDTPLGPQSNHINDIKWELCTAAGKATWEYIRKKREGVGATLYDPVDFWQLENADKLKEQIDRKLEALDWAT
ncbi:hypothetical protein AOQ84DRAFT_367533 [Glonium stellatum]|uniref:Uncharacterized protein n=1 Tax=Glonium stellatum TaxID=574774 RepID=A0A8E2JPL5_9PEZI|nr:hypothetical protein AOQ84DRAFT_367533 [Glonium stellatum]